MISCTSLTNNVNHAVNKTRGDNNLWSAVSPGHSYAKSIVEARQGVNNSLFLAIYSYEAHNR
jgi:hypothetical protein